MTDRDEKGSEIRDRATNRRERPSSRRERMGRRFNDETTQLQSPEDTSASACQAETRNGTPCSNTASNGEYCNKHAPNEYGEKTWEYKRKQWHLHPDNTRELFQETDFSDPSLYLELRMKTGSDISKKSFENTAAEFLIEHSDEFLDFACDKYAQHGCE